jgi:predicted NUDIX family NTP pyrophosphohydrolase
MSAEIQSFPAYVSSIKGHLVPRPDGGGRSYFGARISSAAERAAGAETIVWDTDQVVPLTAIFLASFPLELPGWLRSGALRKRTHEDYVAWLELERARDEAEQAEQAAAKAAAEAKDAEAK